MLESVTLHTYDIVGSPEGSLLLYKTFGRVAAIYIEGYYEMCYCNSYRESVVFRNILRQYSI